MNKIEFKIIDNQFQIWIDNRIFYQAELFTGLLWKIYEEIYPSAHTFKDFEYRLEAALSNIERITTVDIYRDGKKVTWKLIELPADMDNASREPVETVYQFCQAEYYDALDILRIPALRDRLNMLRSRVDDTHELPEMSKKPEDDPVENPKYSVLSFKLMDPKAEGENWAAQWESYLCVRILIDGHELHSQVGKGKKYGHTSPKEVFYEFTGTEEYDEGGLFLYCCGECGLNDCDHISCSFEIRGSDVYIGTEEKQYVLNRWQYYDALETLINMI